MSKGIGDSGSYPALVERSITAWHSLNFVGEDQARWLSYCTELLRGLTSLETLLQNAQFWFFQSKESFIHQSLLMKWNPNDLDTYVLLPVHNGFVNKQDCFFVSHYWRTPQHPDPDGEDMRDFINDLRPLEWSYIWVDWTCLPQSPRSENQSTYFKRMLQFIPALVRECGMEWRFPNFAPRAWVLFEVAEYLFTISDSVTITDDIAPFFSHIIEMGTSGVRPVLSKYNYVCTNGSEMRLIIGWLELLIVLAKVVPNVGSRRYILDLVEKEEAGSLSMPDLGIRIDKVNGILSCNGTNYDFTPVFNLRGTLRSQ